jgi:Holliday junction resolvase-like predicted endonuclease
MANIGENVVRVWLQFCEAQFVMMNVPYPYRSRTNKKMTREIDILATDGKDQYADYEVKWRTTDWIGASKSEKIPALIEQLINKYRNDEITRILKKSFGYVRKPFVRKVLVTPRKHFGKLVFRKRLEALESAGIELLWFEKVLQDLALFLENAQDKGQYDPLTLGVLRMVKHLNV